MKFTLSADGAQSVGQGIGSLFKAYALGPQMRQQAEQDAMKSAAELYYRRMMGDQASANAEKLRQEAALAADKLSLQQNALPTAMLELGLPTAKAADFKTRLETGQWGGQYAAPADGMGPTMPAPADDGTVAKLGQTLALMQRMYGTGSNVEMASKAALNEQTGRIRDQALAAVDNLDRMNRLNTLTKEGQTYTPFDAIGTTGYSVNKATGQGEGLDVLRKRFGEESGARVAKDRGAANASNASAGKYSAEARQTNLETNILEKTGSKPSSGAEGSEGALSSTILRTLQIPALDGKGRPVRNPITGELETQTDQEALKSFYTWAAGNSRKPTATAFAQWEAQGRPSGNKNPPPAQTPPKMDTQATAAALTKARKALAKGAPRDKVIERLRQNGIDPTGL